jgi:DNA ligase-1
MKRFTQLCVELDRTNRTNEKVAALESYFREAPPADAAWALYFLCGRTVPRAINSAMLRSAATDAAALPAWLVRECYGAVGDLAETVALILPQPAAEVSLPLHELIENRLLLLRAGGQTARSILLKTWRELNTAERFVWNKFITGSFRMGVSQTLVTRALANVAGIQQSVMSHRLMGQWQPSPHDYSQIVGADDGAADSPRPYPFFLASPLEGPASDLGQIQDWQLEWKWDGIRAQLIRRGGRVMVWTRGDELAGDTFPEIADLGNALPDGTVLDGEILAWENESAQPFARLQHRLGRKVTDAKLRAEFPVVFLAFDLLETARADWRDHPLTQRRQKLSSLVEEVASQPTAKNASALSLHETPDLFDDPALRAAPFRAPLRLSPLINATSWEELAALRSESRSRHVEGIMLKRLSSPYGVGRQRGDWWKWKIEPLVMDAVLISAQLGSGRRASLYTDYTFGVWNRGELIPVAKAYSGLDDEEILRVDKFVRANTEDRFGPIRAVKPKLVFELAFEAIQKSSRHKSGIAVRFPRINRWRHDKKPEDADTLETLEKLLSSAPEHDS